MEQLDVSIRDEIDALMKQAKEQISAGEKAQGIKTAETAWDKVPAPKFGWDVSKSFAHLLAVGSHVIMFPFAAGHCSRPEMCCES